MKKRIGIYTLFLFMYTAFAQPTAFKHLGAVSSVVAAGEGTFFTAGEDGFVAKWNGNDASHYQLSFSPIKILAVSKDGRLVAIYENDNMASNRVSVWDWNMKQKKFARSFSNTVTSLSFSPKGTYLIASSVSMNSVTLLSSENGNVVRKLKANIPSVSYAALSDSEQTMFTYSTQSTSTAKNSGVITYADMKSGLIKMNNGRQLRFNTDANLKQVSLFHNNVFLSAVKDGNVKIIAADSGSVISSFPAINPIILQDENGNDLYYIEGEKDYRNLMRVSVAGRQSIGTPDVLSTVIVGSEKVTAGAERGKSVMLATNKGNVYLGGEGRISLLTSNTYKRVLDVAVQGESFYFLTEKEVIKSSYDNPDIVKIASNDGKTNMTIWDEGIVLWSRGTLRPVVLLDTARSRMALDSIIEHKKEVVGRVLFTPNAAITSLCISDGKIIYAEGGKTVKSFDIATGNSEDIYSDSSIQDVIKEGGAIYVGKASALSASSPLIKIDSATYETSMTSVQGNIAFSLATDGSYIYGIRIGASAGEKDREKTIVFSYNLATGMTRDIITFASEDMKAFVAVEGNRLITNLGGTAAMVYNTSTKKSTSLLRSTSFPAAAASLTSYTVIVGKDGAVFWYNNDKKEVLSSWYLQEIGKRLFWRG